MHIRKPTNSFDKLAQAIKKLSTRDNAQAGADQSGELIRYGNKMMTREEAAKQPRVVAYRKALAESEGSKKAVTPSVRSVSPAPSSLKSSLKSAKPKVRFAKKEVLWAKDVVEREPSPAFLLKAGRLPRR